MLSKTLKRILLTTLFCGTLCSSVPAYAWDSKADVNIDDTHKVISVQALKMIKNDIKSDSKLLDNLNLLEQNILSYRKGAVAPDFGTLDIDSAYRAYEDHFFDADTGKNFSSTEKWYWYFPVLDTAESQSRNFVSQAVAKWKEGDYAQASFLLGKASHFFADINEPHHASNSIAGPGKPHAPFEQYVEKEKDKFKIDTMGADKSEYTKLPDLNLTDFITAQAVKYGKIAKTQASNATMSNSWEEWANVADITMKNAQKSTATVIYRFLKEVTYGGQPLVAPIGRFHVVIKTADETYSGTDDYVYFGMETKSGKKIEFPCDLAGNDFRTSSIGSYQHEITDPSFDPNDIKSVWIRKAKFGAGDDWKPASLDVYIQGQRIAHKDINEWLSGNTTYNVPVNISK